MDEPDGFELMELVEQTRLLMADVGDNQYLDDNQVRGYLRLNSWRVRRAAADALDAVATSEVLVGKVIRTQDLQTDGAKVADALRAHAHRLRRLADEEDGKADWFGFDVVDTIAPTGRRRPERTGRQVWGL